MTGQESHLQGAWDRIYAGIKDCNVPLSRIKSAVENGNLDVDLGKRLEGELKFIRAFYYFNAIRLWGHIPLILKPVESGKNAFNIKQASEKDVFNAIIKDLTFAKDNLPLSYSGPNQGRITKGAAEMLLAKVYLWEKDPGKAQMLLQDVKNSGQYSLLSDYAKIFDPKNNIIQKSFLPFNSRQAIKGLQVTLYTSLHRLGLIPKYFQGPPIIFYGEETCLQEEWSIPTKKVI
jgi:hypothetical protein